MSCLACRQSKLLPPRSEDDCLEAALERIRNHVLFYKNSTNETEQRLHQLQERNERLTQAVLLLRRQQSSGAQDQSPPPKRKSKTSPTTPVFSEDDDDKAFLPASQSQLNMALNSQQVLLLDSSALSVSPGPGTTAVADHSDSIAETERTEASPRKLQTHAKILQRRQQQQQKSPQKINNNNNDNENLNPSIAVPALTKSSTTIWLSKDRASTSTASAFAERTSEWASKFIKPQATATKAVTKNLIREKAGPSIKKTTSLSLSKRGTTNTNAKKFQQTRLQLDVAPKERSFSGAESTFCEDVIEASPNTNASITKSKAKVTRSWCLRTGNSSASASRTFQNGQLLTLTNDGNKDDDIFNLCSTKRQTEYIPKQKPDSSSDVNADAQIEFELRSDDLASNATNISSDILMKPIDSSSSSSVVLLTPATQDIIFLDDSTCVGDDGVHGHDTTQIKSMDLLHGFMRTDDATNLERLKQIESERIKKIQAEAAANKATAATKTQSSKNLSKEKIKVPLKIKQENISLAPAALPTAPTNTSTRNAMEMEHSSSEELDDCMPRPIMLKKEDKSAPPLPRQSFEERFNINCTDCRNYVKFFGDTMSDADIAAHLRKCTSHNMRPNTPEGFWNPFILSFAPDDPRNEVLIDNRFVGKKRST